MDTGKAAIGVLLKLAEIQKYWRRRGAKSDEVRGILRRICAVLRIPSLPQGTRDGNRKLIGAINLYLRGVHAGLDLRGAGGRGVFGTRKGMEALLKVCETNGDELSKRLGLLAKLQNICNEASEGRQRANVSARLHRIFREETERVFYEPLQNVEGKSDMGPLIQTQFVDLQSLLVERNLSAENQAKVFRRCYTRKYGLLDEISGKEPFKFRAFKLRLLGQGTVSQMLFGGGSGMFNLDLLNLHFGSTSI